MSVKIHSQRNSSTAPKVQNCINMKKYSLITLVIIGFTSGAFAQGQVLLANNSTSLCYTCIAGSIVPAPVGSLSFQLYAGPVGSTSQLTPLFPIAPTSPIAPGRIGNTIINVTQVAPGAQATFQIYAWSSAFATYNEAEASGGHFGRSILFIASTSANGSPPTLPNSLAGHYPGFTVSRLECVPEPSTYAMGIIGACALMSLRPKRKNKIQPGDGGVGGA
ncbi:MAG: hypothetical protein ABIV39_16820 [Verrucomicrobiota bacterium]